MIIGIKGKAGSGKDYIANLIVKELENYGAKVSKYAFADCVKSIAGILLNVPRQEFDVREFKENIVYSKYDGNLYDLPNLPEGHEYLTIRQILQKIGTEAMQTQLGKNVWVFQTFKKIKKDNIYNGYDFNIITDVRFKHEYDYIIKQGGIVIDVKSPYVKDNDDHVSENDLNNIDCYFTIFNNWKDEPESIEVQVKELLKRIK